MENNYFGNTVTEEELKKMTTLPKKEAEELAHQIRQRLMIEHPEVVTRFGGDSIALFLTLLDEEHKSNDELEESLEKRAQSRLREREANKKKISNLFNDKMA